MGVTHREIYYNIFKVSGSENDIKNVFLELNEKINAISFRDPTKLNPWRHFNKKRKLEDQDQDFIKNPRPVKKIILQPRITNARVRKGFFHCPYWRKIVSLIG